MDLSTVRPEPDEEEVAAIAAALEAFRSSQASVRPPRDPSVWRFSGRWWMQPLRLGGWTRNDRCP